MSASNCVQLVVNVAPIVTYWFGRSWLMVNTSFASSLSHVFSRTSDLNLALFQSYFLFLGLLVPLSWTFALHVDTTVPPSTILVPFPGVCILVSLSTSFHCYNSLVSGEFDHRVDGGTYCFEASHSGPSYYDVVR
ncbi:hypothetical protein Tco_0368950 [Tanacetum coccineum]